MTKEQETTAMMENVKPFRRTPAKLAGGQVTLASAVFSDGERLPLCVSVSSGEHGPTVEISRGNIGASWFYATLAGTSSLDRVPRKPGVGLWINAGLKIGIDGNVMDEIMAWLLAEVGPPPFTPYKDYPDLPF